MTHTEDDIRHALTRAMGREFDYEILSVLRWVRRELVADRYGTQRVFIAGDAAHLMSPTGGFGMNTGIQDAVDLGWKLEAGLRGWGGRAARSYETERRPVAVRNVTEATRNLGRMLAARQPGRRRNLRARAGGRRRARGVRRWFTEMMRREWFTIGFHLGYRYDGSPIVWPTARRRRRLTDLYPDRAAGGARAARLAAGRAFDARSVRPRLRPAAAGRDAPAASACARGSAGRRAARRGRHRRARRRALYERRLVLVRPDGHVAWRADAEPADARAVIDVVRGARRLR